MNPDRRHGLCALAGALLIGTSPTHARTAPKVHRIGVLAAVDEDFGYFISAMREAGYEDGRNVVYTILKSDQRSELDAAARKLVAARVDVVVASSAEQVRAAQRATNLIPIVMFYTPAPVELGLVSSLAQPGGNVTGTAAVPVELAAKSIDLFRQVVPSLRRMAILVGDDEWGRAVSRETQRAAASFGIATQVFRPRRAESLDGVLEAVADMRPGGLSVGLGLLPQYEDIIIFAASRRLPAIYPVAPAVIRLGGLMSYSPNLPVLTQRTTAIVDRVLHGVRPRDVPVEQPTQYVLAINLKTANALRLTVPQPLLLRADVVIE